MIYSGWSLLENDAPKLLGMVYNSDSSLMFEKGFDTANVELTVYLPHTKIALDKWITDFKEFYTYVDEEHTPSTAQSTMRYNWESLYQMFDGDYFTCTYDELYEYIYNYMMNPEDMNYEGKQEDFDRVTAAMEALLLDEMIAVPLFSTSSSNVYKNSIIFEADSFHYKMGWGGYKYMYIGKNIYD